MPAKQRTQPEGSQQYRARVAIAYPTSAAAIARIQAGEQVPWAERAVREVAAGEVVADIPATSLGWLLEQGIVEPWPARSGEETTEEGLDGEVG